MKTVMTYDDLPDGTCVRAAHYQGREALYGYLSKQLIDSLAGFFAGRRVLEVYAGRGHLSALLQARGVESKATSLRSSHDGSEMLGHVIEVEDLSVGDAVLRYRDWFDVLLVCWPTTSEALYRVLSLLPAGALIVFIGEVTDYSRQPAFLGGCASDAFFDAVEEIPELTARLRYPTPRCDTIKVYRARQQGAAQSHLQPRRWGGAHA